MPNSRLPVLSRRPARWRRPLLWTLGAVLALEVLSNTVLVTGLLATVINHFTHEHPRVEWSRAWSLVPGRIHFRNLKLRHEDERGTSWQLELDEVKAHLSLLSLLKRTLKTDSLDVRGLRVQVRSAPQETDEEKPSRPPPEDPWKLFLHGVQIQQVHEVAVDALQLTGISSASGSLELVPGHRLSVRDGRAELWRGHLTYEGGAVARLHKSSGTFNLHTQRQGPDKGLDFITGLTGLQLEFSATHPPLHEMSWLTSRLKGVSLRGGAGKLKGSLVVKEGRLVAGTAIMDEAEPLDVSGGTLSLTMKTPWLWGSGLYTQEDSKDRWATSLNLGPVRLSGGEGPALEIQKVELVFAADPPRRDQPPQNAQLKLHASRLKATWGGATLRADVSAEVGTRGLFLEGGEVTLHGSKVELREVALQTGGDEVRNWEGTLNFPEATLALSPPAVQGRFSGRFTSAAPFISLLTSNGALPGVLAPLLTAKNLGVSGAMSLGEEGLKVRKLVAIGQGLELRGTAESAGDVAHAVLLVKLGPLSVGVETGAGNTHVQLLNASSWYQQKTDAPKQ